MDIHSRISRGRKHPADIRVTLIIVHGRSTDAFIPLKAPRAESEHQELGEWEGAVRSTHTSGQIDSGAKGKRPAAGLVLWDLDSGTPWREPPATLEFLTPRGTLY